MFKQFKFYFALLSFNSGAILADQNDDFLQATRQHENFDHWLENGLYDIKKTLSTLNDVNTNVAKNVIIFVGDGMSLSTVTAARIYKGQHIARLNGRPANGEEHQLTFDKFPHVALSKTYCVDGQTTDSAASATAMFTGIKTNIYTLGFDSSIVYQDPVSEKSAKKIDYVLKWAQDAGKETGIVTTARLAHATPAALYAHAADRDWECDKKMGHAANSAKDITWQLINSDPGLKIKVLLGGGLSSFLPEHPTEEDKLRWNFSQDDWECRRLDGDNLIDQFLNRSLEDLDFKDKTLKFVQDRSDLLKLNISDTDFLLGLFSWDHMLYEHERERELPVREPSLAEMTSSAIEMLQKGKDGFFLMVEGAKIDMGHHDGKATVALHETMAFDLAIETALKMTNPNETLVIVTAGTETIKPFCRLVTPENRAADSDLAEDNKPYHILSYANGPGYYEHYTVENGKVSRLDKSQADFTNFDYLQPSGVPTEDETHSGADVGIFATGPFSHLFHSVHEQSYIAYVMAYSACIGPFKDDCHTQKG